MQQTLQEKYKDKWETIGPEAGKHKLLWMIGEIGEVVDIIKKNGDVKALEDHALRRHPVSYTHLAWEPIVSILSYS